MNGADQLCDTLLANGVDVCFANPGTSEMHFVAALDRKPQMRCVLGLFEGVVTGAADGYARITGKPAATLLHLGPGLANGLANLHNARRARSPIVNVVGEHATYHQQYDAPLTSDIESLARPMSHWVHRIAAPEAVGKDTARAVGEALRKPGQVATLILPADCAWGELPKDTRPVQARLLAAPAPDVQHIEHVARAMLRAIQAEEQVVLFLGPQALEPEALQIAGRIAQAIGARLMTPTAFRRMQRGRGTVAVERLPYVVDAGLQALAEVQQLVLLGAPQPVAFFAYPGKPSTLAPAGCAIHTACSPEEDALLALQALAAALGVDRKAPLAVQAAGHIHAPTSGPLTASAVNLVALQALPEGAIVVDESITSGRDIAAHNMQAVPHDWLVITGGAIGQGIPTAVGAAIGAPSRQVVAFQADGSAMYTCQGLWTQAREKLKCLTIIYANRSYAILHGEMKAVGTQIPGENAQRMLTLDQPAIRWTQLAESMGVPAVRCETVEDFKKALQAGLAENGPFLIEAVI